jgi:AcrR family transcriptional regulator
MSMAKIDQAAVMHAAAALVAEEGLDAVTMTSVASRLGIRPPSLYSRYTDRDAVLDKLAQQALSALTDVVADAAAGRSGRDAVAAVVDAHRRFAAAEPGLWAALQRPVPHARAAAGDGARLVALLSSALRDYRLPEAELVHAVRFLGATINGFISLERSGGFAHRAPETAESWTRAVNALHVALSSWPSGEEHAR